MKNLINLILKKTCLLLKDKEIKSLKVTMEINRIAAENGRRRILELEKILTDPLAELAKQRDELKKYHFEKQKEKNEEILSLKKELEKPLNKN